MPPRPPSCSTRPTAGTSSPTSSLDLAAADRGLDRVAPAGPGRAARSVAGGDPAVRAQTLNGADHEMYDYLAEEVVGDLPEELQRFLMDTSILQVVTPSSPRSSAAAMPPTSRG